jgi:hypothetical protein
MDSFGARPPWYLSILAWQSQWLVWFCINLDGCHHGGWQLTIWTSLADAVLPGCGPPWPHVCRIYVRVYEEVPHTSLVGWSQSQSVHHGPGLTPICQLLQAANLWPSLWGNKLSATGFLSGYCIDLLNDSFQLSHWFTQWLLLVIALIYSTTSSDYCIDLLNDSLWLSHWFTQWLLPTIALIYSMTLLLAIALIYSTNPLDYRTDLLNDTLSPLLHWFNQWLPSPTIRLIYFKSFQLLHWFTQQLPSPTIALIYSMTPSNYCNDCLNDSLLRLLGFHDATCIAQCLLLCIHPETTTSPPTTQNGYNGSL